ncbi:MAG: Flp family type IVb pilin [bacterium]
MRRICKNRKSKGQSLVEYGLILALVSVVAITVLQTMGGQIKTTVSGLTAKLQQANQISQQAST